jgi:hypothetical protein
MEPFAPFVTHRNPYKHETKRYRVDCWLDGRWRPVSGKTDKLDEVIRHSEAAYSGHIRIFDQRRNRQVYEREADDGQAFEWIEV